MVTEIEELYEVTRTVNIVRSPILDVNIILRDHCAVAETLNVIYKPTACVIYILHRVY